MYRVTTFKKRTIVPCQNSGWCRSMWIPARQQQNFRGRSSCRYHHTDCTVQYLVLIRGLSALSSTVCGHIHRGPTEGWMCTHCTVQFMVENITSRLLHVLQVYTALTLTTTLKNQCGICILSVCLIFFYKASNENFFMFFSWLLSIFKYDF